MKDSHTTLGGSFTKHGIIGKKTLLNQPALEIWIMERESLVREPYTGKFPNNFLSVFPKLLGATVAGLVEKKSLFSTIISPKWSID